MPGATSAQMWVTNAMTAALSVITGGGKWVELTIPTDAERQPSDPHHIRFAQQPALGRNVSDEFTVPLCRTDHRACRRVSDVRTWPGSARCRDRKGEKGVDGLIPDDNRAWTVY
jgi:hypothetical protein